MWNIRLAITTLLWTMLPANQGVAEGKYQTLEFPASTKQGEMPLGVTYTLWIPPDVTTIRGIIVHQHGCGVGACQGGETAAYDLHWQALARRWDFALLGPSYHQAADQDCQLWCDPRNGSGDLFVQALTQFAKQTGRPEIQHAPWCLWGHSGGGFWASLMQLQYPQQIVAIWFQSGTAYPRWMSGEIKTPTIPDAAMKIPMMVNVGLKERDHPRFQAAWTGGLAMFRDYRSRAAPIAFAPDPHSGHETRDARYLAIPFFDACLQQRLPAQVGKPLLEMDDSLAWLAPVPDDPNSKQVSPLPQTEFQGDVHDAVWLPDRDVAKAWAEFVQTGGVSDTSRPPAPTQVTTHPTDVGIEVTWQAQADYESGIQAFEIYREGRLIGRLPSENFSSFGLPLFQSMSYHDTPQQPLPEMNFVDQDPLRSRPYAVTTINTAGLKSVATTARVHRDIAFAEVDGNPLALDLYLPNPPTAQPSPLVVWIHGGGWRRGSKDNVLVHGLLKEGYALASISYRLTPEAIFPAQIHDCKAAIRWLRAHADEWGYNSDWIAVAGSSAGGHLALLLGLTSQMPSLEGRVGSHFDQSTQIQAIVDYYGPTDFVRYGKTQPARAYRKKSASFALLGGIQNGEVTRDMERFASPVTYVTDDAPPLLIFHGTNDRVVSIDQSHQITRKYDEVGLKSQLVILPEVGHGGKSFFTPQRLRTVVEFLQRHHPKTSN